MEILSIMMNRKEFITSVSAIASGMFLPGFVPKLLNVNSGNQILFDLHCHPGIFFTKETDRYPGDEAVGKTIDDMNKAKLTGTFVSLVADTPLLIRTDKGITYEKTFEKGEAWLEFKRQMKVFKEMMDSVQAELLTKSSELTMDRGGKVGVFCACEGGDFIEGLDVLDEAYEEGLRSVQLVHYVPNHIGDLQTAASMHNGLSALGKDAVKKMNKLGMVIDVAHASEKTVEDVANLTDAPIMLSHSILKMEKDRPIGARAISESHAKLVMGTGGLIGAWPSGFNKSLDEFIDNTMRLIDVVGIDHVGLGTDMDANFKPVLDNYSLLSSWITGLKAKGLSDEELYKVGGGNAQRLLNEVLKF